MNKEKKKNTKAFLTNGYLTVVDTPEENEPKSSTPSDGCESCESANVTTIVVEVIGCKKLNVRKSADTSSTVVAVLDKGDTATANLIRSGDEFYYITTSSGITGYCMKNYMRQTLYENVDESGIKQFS